MAYIEPLVMVYQEYATLSTTTTTATLPACIIGPCYHIIDPIEDAELAYIGKYTGSIQNQYFPENKAGAIIDSSSVKFYLKEPKIRLKGTVGSTPTDNDTVQALVDGNVLTLSDEEFAKIKSLIKVADFITPYKLLQVSSASSTQLSSATITESVFDSSWEDYSDDELYRVYSYKKRTVTSGSSSIPYWDIVLDKKLIYTPPATSSNTDPDPVAATAIRFYLDRLGDSFQVTYDEAVASGFMATSDLDVENEEFSIMAITHAINEVEYPVASAEFYVGYRALRQDLSEVGSTTDVTDLKGKLGKIDPANPLAYGVSIALANSSDTPIHYVGIDSDDLEGYTQAKDYIENYSPLYSIVPLTFSTAVLTMFKSHAEAMSEPELGQWRIAIGCTELPSRVEVTSGSATLSVMDTNKLRVLTDRSGSFMSSDVDEGDTIAVTLLDDDGEETGDTFEYSVSEVASNDVLSVPASSSFSVYPKKITATTTKSWLYTTLSSANNTTYTADVATAETAARKAAGVGGTVVKKTVAVASTGTTTTTVTTTISENTTGAAAGTATSTTTTENDTTTVTTDELIYKSVTVTATDSSATSTDPSSVTTFNVTALDSTKVLYTKSKDEATKYAALVTSGETSTIGVYTYSTTYTSAAYFAANSSVNYVVYKSVDKAGQASAIAARSSAYGSRRFINVWPDVCVVDDVELPGYYLCCAIAGAVATLQPHYGLTRTSLAGIDAVKHSNDYFNRTQLNTIAGGGTFIFVQETPDAAPYVRHQLTTDYGTIEFQELSMVKNFDYVSYICKDVLDQYIGKWNIVSDTLNAIRTTLAGTLENLRLDSYPKIGSPIVSYSIGDISQRQDVRDRVEAYVYVTFPYPLNTLALHIVSE